MGWRKDIMQSESGKIISYLYDTRLGFDEYKKEMKRANRATGKKKLKPAKIYYYEEIPVLVLYEN